MDVRFNVRGSRPETERDGKRDKRDSDAAPHWATRLSTTLALAF